MSYDILEFLLEFNCYNKVCLVVIKVLNLVLLIVDVIN